MSLSWLYHDVSPFTEQTTILLDLGLRLEVIAGNEIGDVIVIIVLIVVVLLVTILTLLLLHALVALGKLAQRCERVGAELVKDAGNELCQLLVLAVTVDGEGVRWYRSVYCRWVLAFIRICCECSIDFYPIATDSETRGKKYAHLRSSASWCIGNSKTYPWVPRSE